MQNLCCVNEFDLHENEPVGGAHFHKNRLRSIYQYSNMDPRLWDLLSFFCLAIPK